MGVLECTCGIRFANVVDLQLHKMDCNHQDRRKSGRKKKKTLKGKAYRESLAEDIPDDSDHVLMDEPTISCNDTTGNEADKETGESQSSKQNTKEAAVKGIGGMMRRLSLDDVCIEADENQKSVSVAEKDCLEKEADAKGDTEISNTSLPSSNEVDMSTGAERSLETNASDDISNDDVVSPLSIPRVLEIETPVILAEDRSNNLDNAEKRRSDSADGVEISEIVEDVEELVKDLHIILEESAFNLHDASDSLDDNCIICAEKNISLEELRKELDKKEEENRNLENLLRKKDQEMDAKGKRILEKEKEVEKCVVENKNLQDQLRQKDEDLAEIQRKYHLVAETRLEEQESEKELEKHKEDNIILKQDLKKKDQELERVTSESSKLKLDQKVLNEKLKRLSDIVKIKSEAIKKMEQKRKTTTETEDSQQNQLGEELKKVKESSVKETKKKDAEIKELNEVIEEKNKKIIELREVVIKSEVKEQKASTNVCELVDELRSRGQELQIKDQELEDITNELKEKSKKQKSLEDTLDHLRDENVVIKNNIKRIQENKEDNELKTLRSSVQELRKFVSKEFAAIKQRIETDSKPLSRKESHSSNQPRKDCLNKPSKTSGLRFYNNGPSEAEERTSEESSDESDDRSSKRTNKRTSKVTKGGHANIRSKGESRSLVIDSEDDYNERRVRMVPGDYPSYAHAVKESKKTFIFSTSITKGINIKELNNKYSKGTAEIHKFSGKRATHIKHYIKSHLTQDKPARVLIHEGGNDLPTPMPIETLADHIIEAGEISQRYGVKEVFIAGVTSRPGLQKRCFKLNDTLERMCKERGYVFINNENISLSHLNDGVHLGRPGSDILMENYLRALNKD